MYAVITLFPAKASLYAVIIRPPADSDLSVIDFIKALIFVNGITAQINTIIAIIANCHELYSNTATSEIDENTLEIPVFKLFSKLLQDVFASLLNQRKISPEVLVSKNVASLCISLSYNVFFKSFVTRPPTQAFI